MVPAHGLVGFGGIVTQTPALPWFIPTEEQVQERERILRGIYFLVRQDGPLGEKMRCRRCHAKHAYFTLMCIEQPFCGLTQGLYAYWRVAGAHGAYQHLPPVERAKYDALNKRFGPDFAESNPRMAASMHVAENDMEMGAIALGTLEPITRQKAQQLLWRINSRGCRPPLTLPGIRGGL